MHNNARLLGKFGEPSLGYSKGYFYVMSDCMLQDKQTFKQR